MIDQTNSCACATWTSLNFGKGGEADTIPNPVGYALRGRCLSIAVTTRRAAGEVIDENQSTS